MHKVIKEIIDRSPHLNWIENGLCFLTLHGSRAYGTAKEDGSSDFGFKGICCPPKKYFYSCQYKFEQAELKAPAPDTVIFEIRKFFNLAINNNPSVIEILFADPSDHQYVNEIGKILLDNKQKFLSKKAKFSFSGYAISQLHKMKLHYGYYHNPIKAPPTRKEFGLPERTLIPKDQLASANAFIQKELDKFNFDFLDGIDEPEKIELRSIMSEMLSNLKLNAEDKWLACARKIGLDDNFIELMQKERAYENKKKTWDNYQTWKINRNTERAQLEAKHGYDCYVEETEFLTEDGWKLFDQISENDKLATVYLGDSNYRKFLGVEYQRYTEKFDGTFNGNLYNLYGYHLDSIVTPNHKMLVQKEERKSGLKGGWTFEEAANLPDTFNIVAAITPNKKNYSNKNIESFNDLPISQEDYLKLMGWYLTDGVMNVSRDSKRNVIRISQIKNGKLHKKMQNFFARNKKNTHGGIYEYTRQPNEYNTKIHTEVSLIVSNKNICEKILKDCNRTVNKRIPRWVFGLSKHQMEFLLNAMIDGDGTRNKKNKSITYYSSSKDLASDFQELAFLCGLETSLYGPYEYPDPNKKTCPMYQVYIGYMDRQYKKCIRSGNIKTIPVTNKRIVCFSVSNSTLITRLNGKIAIQGNCKNAYHLVRLMRECREILTKGTLTVKRTDDREELLAIRNGAWTYEQVLEWAEKEDVAMNKLYKTSSTVPHSCNKEELDKLCIELIEKSLCKHE